MIEFLVAGVVALVMYRGGYAHGRYGSRKKLLATYINCGCGHSNAIHHVGGRGSCDWHNNERTIRCYCKRFTPTE